MRHRGLGQPHWAFESANVLPPSRPRVRAAVSSARVRSRIAPARTRPAPRRCRRPAAVVVSICAPCPLSTTQAHAAGRQILHGVDQVGQGAAETVELPDDEHVARPERAHAAVDPRPVVADAGREVPVDVDGRDARGLQRVALQVPRPGAFRSS